MMKAHFTAEAQRTMRSRGEGEGKREKKRISLLLFLLLFSLRDLCYLCASAVKWAF